MPNHVINELIFRNVDIPGQDRIIAAACPKDGNVDFKILVPPPLNLWMGSVGSVHEKAFKRTALDWNRENWGTKWNAYSISPIERDETSITMRFQTAWSPPYPWLAAMFNHLAISFDHNWFDEGSSRGVHGEFRQEGRPGWNEPDWIENPASDELHRHLHKLMFGVEEFEDESE